jgi:serine/threonine-protein kinase
VLNETHVTIRASLISVAEPHTFGRYRVTKPLGAGAMGEVYEAVDDVLGRDVAIKTLRTTSGALFLDDRFRNEARAIAKLTHPNIVAVFDVDVAATPPYLVMERVPGPSLADRLSGGPLPTEQLIPLGIQIARALATAHEAGVVHRDVKPANVLAAGAGTWKLADFGVAHVPDSSLTMTGQFVGSPAYAAPEALVKGITGGASDVYGLGATLYEAAAGRWPRLEAKGALLAPVPPLRTLAPNLPAHVADAIDRAVSIDHEKRPSAAELAELLARQPPRTTATAPAPLAVAHPTEPVPTTPLVAAPPTSTVRWKPYAIGLAALVALAVVLSTRHSTPSQPAIDPLPTSEERTDINAELQQIADQANSGDVEGAREHLDELEHEYGPNPAFHDLRKQLDRLRKHHGRD